MYLGHFLSSLGMGIIIWESILWDGCFLDTYQGTGGEIREDSN